jgi:hypothetical protein
MTAIKREPVKTIWCDRIGDNASLVEVRVFLGDSPAAIATNNSHVLKQECSHSIECNLNGCPCRWSYLNPDYDPFLDVLH